MTKPRDSGKYNALTLRTRLDALIEAKTNFITAYHEGVGVGTVLITVPLTKAQYDRSTTGLAEASTPANLAATLAELAVRSTHSDDMRDIHDLLATDGVDDGAEDLTRPNQDAGASGDDVEPEHQSAGLGDVDVDVEVHDAEELPPGSADRLAQHSSVDHDIGDATDGRVTSEGDLVYMLSSRRKAYQVVALGTHVATLSHVLDDGSVGYVTVPYGTFGFLDEVDSE